MRSGVALPCTILITSIHLVIALPQIMKRVEAILYAPTAEDGRQILMDTQNEFAGRTFLEEDEAAAQVRG